jgi:hypothetical protein
MLAVCAMSNFKRGPFGLREVLMHKLNRVPSNVIGIEGFEKFCPSVDK